MPFPLSGFGLGLAASMPFMTSIVSASALSVQSAHSKLLSESICAVQEETYATGLDTACVAGGKLTACILPPAAEVRMSALHAYLPVTSGKLPAPIMTIAGNVDRQRLSERSLPVPSQVQEQADSGVQVQRRRSKWPSASSPVTLNMLGGSIVSTPSQQNYLLQQDGRDKVSTARRLFS